MSFLLDTDILSLFAKAGAIDLLLRLLRVERLAITQGVFTELTVPLEYGYRFPHSYLRSARSHPYPKQNWLYTRHCASQGS